MSHLSRRALMRTSAFSLLGTSLWPGRLFASDVATEAVQFVVVNDLHYIDAACGAHFAKLAKHIKALDAKPAGVFLAGDLSDHGTRAELGGLREALAAVGLPIWAVPGNHDFVTPTSCADYDAVWPDAHDRVVELGDWQFVLLDTTDGQKWKGTTIRGETLAFAEDPKLDKRKPTVLITHFPFNSKVDTTPTNAEALLDRFKEHNLVATFGGHFHGHTTRERGATVCTTNSCCSLKKNNHDGTKEKGYFLCTARDAKVEAKFVEFNG